MLRLLVTAALVMTALFATATMALSRVWETAGEMDEGWRVVYGREVMNLEGSNIGFLPLSNVEMVSGIDCSPDGNTLAYIEEDTIYVARSDGEELGQISRDTRPAEEVYISNDGKVALTSTYDGRVYIVWLENAQWTYLTDILPTGDLYYRARFDLSSDGSRIAYQTEPLKVDVVKADGTVLTEIPGAYMPAWSQQGLLAFAAEWDGNSDIYVMDVDRSVIAQMTHQDENFGNAFPAWSPDGNRIFYSYYVDRYSQFGDLYAISVNDSSPHLLGRISQITCLLTAQPTSLIANP
jgi:Tol biopolymer transport system component